jgi:uncharacterized protein YeaO (DUF488 family)
MSLALKRAYEPASPQDGYRILVDRMWPRGLSKERAAIDLWLKEIAPSTELRKWFNHDPAKWAEFKKRYFRELDSNKELVDIIRSKARTHKVTLVYAAKDELHNNAVALLEYLR